MILRQKVLYFQAMGCRMNSNYIGSESFEEVFDETVAEELSRELQRDNRRYTADFEN